MRRLASLSLFLFLGIHVVAFAQTDWLPSEVRSAMAREMAAKVTAADTEGRVTEEQALEGGRAGVEGLVVKVESLGVDGLARLAPTFPELNVPKSGSPLLDAIALYGVCSFPMDAMYADDSPRDGAFDQRVYASFMSMSVVIVSAYLRSQYLTAGITDEQAKAFLASDAMGAMAYRIKSRVELLQHAMNRCAGPLSTLME